MSRQEWRVLVRNILIEIVTYGVLVAIYTIFVLRPLGEPLARLFHSSLVSYAFVAIGVIVAQGALLSTLITFLTDRIGLGRIE